MKRTGRLLLPTVTAVLAASAALLFFHPGDTEIPLAWKLAALAVAVLALVLAGRKLRRNDGEQRPDESPGRPDMAVPAPALILVVAALALLAVPLVLTGLPETAVRAWMLTALAPALVALVDLQRGLLRPRPSATRRTPDALAVHRPATVEILLDNRELAGDFLLADHHPGDDPETGLPAQITRAEGEQTRVRYRYCPSRRGTAAFGAIELWQPSPWRLWNLRRDIPATARLPVYPDFSAALPEQLARPRSARTAGMRMRPRSGEGQEFHQLREYRSGDRLRQIDWNATARRRTLISREYREETTQPLIILLDGGQRLAAPVNHLCAFDYALNCTLLLAASALEAGDRPGMLLHSGEEEIWLPPMRGGGGLNRLLRTLYPLAPTEGASDFTTAARGLLHRYSRRATLVWITRLQPDDHDDLLQALRLLGRRHRVLIGDMQLPAQQALRHHSVEDFDTGLQVAADARYQAEQKALHLRLRHAGVPVVSATPDQMGARLNALYQSLRRNRRL